MDKKKAITIKDVAKKAGVSSSTVSRVISKSPKISPETTNTVLECMEELGYHPNAIARSLVSRKAGTIGVIMPSTSKDALLNPFFPEALRGITYRASNAGYDILLSTNDSKEEELAVIKKYINSSKVDGIVLMSSEVGDICVEYLSSVDFPFTIIGSPSEHGDRINHVDNDNYMATYELTRYLTMKGRKNIAMIAGDLSLMVTKKRIEGYQKALEESNVPFDEKKVYTGSFDEKTGYEYASIIADLNPTPDGVIVTDDLVAFAAVRLFKQLKLEIPKDIAVASFNNSVLSRYSNPPLTSVDVNALALGEESIKLLIRAIEKGDRGNKIIIPHIIYKRKSTEED
ncbi:LacI family DNA-binding transcriptional regulator [Isachenkonia alkalipeptolytica]|uniref:LacI family transcriptional regulator n=1 Tax=Isachenkonia alkalipeptolytica TaxID=2565777 RepID=A0AA43XIF8_9CLOT|nr:LacI family DNA-binding transcriptional regulator [Isachenkonia alkalipeptolytica]NBG86886.1 LacI family transcriptional regulator [Isachenkonia alkalipeptolytica]